MQQVGKTALVTGSGRGIGRAIALRLAKEGAYVVVNFFRNQAPAEETAEQIRSMGRKAGIRSSIRLVAYASARPLGFRRRPDAPPGSASPIGYAGRHQPVWISA